MHAVLDANATQQTVLVERTLTGRIAVADSTKFDPLDPIASGGGDPIAGARVVISSENGDSAVAVEDAARRPDRKGRGVYRVATALSIPVFDVLTIVPGRRYLLSVTTPDGRVVTGSTRVPVATRVPDSQQVFDRRRDTLRLRWADARAARTYAIRMDTPYGAFFLFSDSARFDLTGDLRNFFAAHLPAAFVPGFRQPVLVTAVDTNFFDYYRSRNDPFSGTGIINHLTGGFGFFGAIALIERRTVDVKQPRTRPIEAVYDANVGTPSRLGLDLYVEQEARGVQALSGYMWFPPPVGLSGWQRSGVLGQHVGSRVTFAVIGATNVAADTADVFTGTFAGDSIVGSFRARGYTVLRRRPGEQAVGQPDQGTVRARHATERP